MNPPKDPILAAILSGLIPGLGQIYCRRWGRGALLFFGALLLGGILPPLGLLIAVGIWIWGIVDAYRIARDAPGQDRDGRSRIIDLGSASFPRIDVRQAAVYAGVPVGIVMLLAVVGLWALSRYGLWNDGGSSNKPERLVARIEAHRADTGSYPDTLEALIDPMDPIEKRQILDSWGRLYRYQRTGDGFELSSAGKDGQAHTEDDIRYYP